MAKKKVEETKQEQHVSLAGYVPNLQKKYKEEIVGKLQKEFGFATVMQVPRLVKITLNQGIGDATGDKKLVEVAQQELTAIAGRRGCSAGAHRHRRPEGRDHLFQKGYLQLQAPPRYRHRSEGYPQGRPHV